MTDDNSRGLRARCARLTVTVVHHMARPIDPDVHAIRLTAGREQYGSCYSIQVASCVIDLQVCA